eukprot:6414416-Pyramimonas_sp.AAC.1
MRPVSSHTAKVLPSTHVTPSTSYGHGSREQMLGTSGAGGVSKGDQRGEQMFETSGAGAGSEGGADVRDVRSRSR